MSVLVTFHLSVEVTSLLKLERKDAQERRLKMTKMERNLGRSAHFPVWVYLLHPYPPAKVCAQKLIKVIYTLYHETHAF